MHLHRILKSPLWLIVISLFLLPKLAEAQCGTAPTISITAGSNPLCSGATITLRSNSTTGNLWNTGATTQSITVSSAGSYGVRKITSGSCTSSFSSATVISAFQPPTITSVQIRNSDGTLVNSYGTSISICSSQDVVFTASNNTAGNNILWSNGQGGNTLSTNNSGTYSARSVSGSCTSSITAAFTVTVTPQNVFPTISVTSGSTTLACSNSSVTLTSSATTGNIWSNGATTRSITVNTPGSYSVNATSGPCTSYSAATTVTSVATIAVTAGSTTLCNGETVTLSAPAGYNYLWSNGATTRTITTSTAGSYTVRTINGTCTSLASDPVVVTIATPAPTIYVGEGSANFCTGGFAKLVAPFGYNYLWSNGETSQLIYVYNTGSYSVRLINGRCTSAVSNVLNITSTNTPTTPTISVLSGSPILCSGASVTLSAPSGFNYLWSNGATTQNITVNSEGTFTVQTINGVCTSAVSNAIGVSSVLVSTLAGTPGLFNFTDGTLQTAKFNNPVSTAFDAAGNLYVADQSNHKIRKITPSGDVTTFAGLTGGGFADGIGANAAFNYPTGIAIDASSNVYVADNNNHRIRKITPSGVVTTLAGSGTAGSANGTGTAAQFNYPYGIAVDASGNVFVSDRNNSQIRKITPSGVVTTFAGNSNRGSDDGIGTSATFYYPLGITIDANGNLYVADNSNSKIRKISSSGVVTTFAGSGSYQTVDGIGTAASFGGVNNIAVDASGNLYVAEYNNYIRKVTPSGVVTTLAGSGNSSFADGAGSSASFYYPSGISIDANGDLLVADSRNNRIRKVTTSGEVSTYTGRDNNFSDGVGTNAAFYGPSSVAIDANGTLYVVDSYNNRIRKVTSTGVVTTLAGSGAQGYADGNGINASFYAPSSLTIDASGNVFVTDTYNNRIRKITPNGDVSTFAGYSSVGISQDGTGTAASFNSPNGITIDNNGNLYVSELGSGNIRKITPSGVVTRIAGNGTSAYGGTSPDGQGTQASFYNPAGLALDASGNLYVADAGNHRIRKITPSGLVTTLSGSSASYQDGSVATALWNSPFGLTFDASGNMYVVSNSHNIRKISTTGQVTTIAGSLVTGSSDGAGTSASFASPKGITIDANGNSCLQQSNAISSELAA